MVPMTSSNTAGPNLTRSSSPVPARSSKFGSKEAFVVKHLDDMTRFRVLVGWMDGWLVGCSVGLVFISLATAQKIWV